MKGKGIGFTNKLAIALVVFLGTGLVGGFVLAWKSIDCGYMGALACYTAVFAPVGTAVGIVLGKVVDKSKAENTEGGIIYAAAAAKQYERDL